VKSIVDPDRVLELNRRFHDEVEATTYDSRMGVDFSPAAVAASIGELEYVLGHPLPAGGVVVDVGAGTGNLAVKLALDGRFAEVIAVDISARMLEEATRSAARQGVQLTTIVNDMSRLPFADHSVDLVVGCAILHHLPAPAAFLREVHRVLKPGAACIFLGEPSTIGERATTLVKSPLLATVAVARRLGLARRRLWDHDAIDVHTFSPTDVDDLARGFARLRFRPEGLLAPVVDQGLLSPMLLVTRGAGPVTQLCDRVRATLRRVDDIIGPLAPPAWRASVKFAAWTRVAGAAT
jgi:2-polyprenyl-3-methyl-5-hydroxy-6-metoxy-1,4-benzoquinol methylase